MGDLFPDAPEHAGDHYPSTTLLLTRALAELGGGDPRHERLTTCAPESDWPELIELIELLATEVRRLRVELIRDREHARHIGQAAATAAVRRTMR